MDKNAEDEIEITAILKRFVDLRLPRALEIEKKIMTEGKLNDSDLAFLEIVFKDAKYILPYTDKHPEYQKLAVKAIQLYTNIMEKALENEKKNKPV